MTALYSLLIMLAILWKALKIAVVFAPLFLFLLLAYCAAKGRAKGP